MGRETALASGLPAMSYLPVPHRENLELNFLAVCFDGSEAASFNKAGAYRFRTYFLQLESSWKKNGRRPTTDFPSHNWLQFLASVCCFWRPLVSRDFPAALDRLVSGHWYGTPLD